MWANLLFGVLFLCSANTITYRNRYKDFEKMSRIGEKAYQKEQKEKAAILNNLLEHYDDGRRKTFFCTAVNLLELDDLWNIMRQIDEIGTEFSEKERAIHVVNLLQEAADQKEICLKLRKKPGKEKAEKWGPILIKPVQSTVQNEGKDPQDGQQLLDNIAKIHTTDMGLERIKRNLHLPTEDVVEYCKDKILEKHCTIYKQGKNWYCEIDNIKITINAHSYTIITAHRI